MKSHVSPDGRTISLEINQQYQLEVLTINKESGLTKAIAIYKEKMLWATMEEQKGFS